MNEEVTKTVKKYYDNVSVGSRTEQSIYFVEQHDKATYLKLFLQEHNVGRTILLVRSKKTADMIEKVLKAQSIEVTAIHGNHKSVYIQKSTTAFNEKKSTFLITTSKIYEALDFEDIETIIYYDLPFEAESYFQTLKAVDEIGTSLSFVSSDEEKMLETLEAMMKCEIPRKEIKSFVHTALPKIIKEKKKKPRHKKNKNKESKLKEK